MGNFNGKNQQKSNIPSLSLFSILTSNKIPAAEILDNVEPHTHKPTRAISDVVDSTIPQKQIQLHLEELLVRAIANFDVPEIHRLLNMKVDSKAIVDNVPLFLHYYVMLMYRSQWKSRDDINEIFNALVVNLDKHTKLSSSLQLDYFLDAKHVISFACISTCSNSEDGKMTIPRDSTIESAVVALYAHVSLHSNVNLETKTLMADIMELLMSKSNKQTVPSDKQMVLMEPISSYASLEHLPSAPSAPSFQFDQFPTVPSTPCQIAQPVNDSNLPSTHYARAEVKHC